MTQKRSTRKRLSGVQNEVAEMHRLEPHKNLGFAYSGLEHGFRARANPALDNLLERAEEKFPSVRILEKGKAKRKRAKR